MQLTQQVFRNTCYQYHGLFFPSANFGLQRNIDFESLGAGHSCSARQLPRAATLRLSADFAQTSPLSLIFCRRSAPYNAVYKLCVILQVLQRRGEDNLTFFDLRNAAWGQNEVSADT